MPKPLAEIVLDAGLADRDGVVRAARLAEQRREPVVVALVRELGIDELALLTAIRKQTRCAVADPASIDVDPEALRRLPGELCRRSRVLPLGVGTSGRALTVGVADPTDAVALAEVEHVVGGEVDVVVLPLSTVEELVERAYRGFETRRLPGRRPFGDGVSPTTQPHARGLAWASAGVGEDTAVTRTTLPYPAAPDDDLGLRLRALVRLLEARGVLAEGELDAAVAALRAPAGGDDELTPPPASVAALLPPDAPGTPER